MNTSLTHEQLDDLSFDKAKIKDCQQLDRIDVIFDSSAEFCKSIVREMFHFSSQSIDGLCASALHLIQNNEFETYYMNRSQRLGKNRPKVPPLMLPAVPVADDIGVLPSSQRDQFIEIYLNKVLIQGDADNFVKPSVWSPQNMETRIKRLSSYHEDDHNELSSYVKNYFRILRTKKTTRQILQMIVKRSLKSVVAVISLWCPSLYKIISSKGVDPVQFVYSNIIDKIRGGSAQQQEPKNKKTLAEFVITSDYKTTGFLEDCQIVIQIAIDQFFLTMKLLFRKGLQTYSTEAQIGDIRDTSIDSHRGFFKKLATLVKNTCIAFFSFTLHKLFLNIPQLPKQIKNQTAIFVKGYLQKYYFPSLQMLRNNVDKRTIQQLITKSGYQYQEYEVETLDGYINRMNRICNKPSFKVVYFQHGVVDNSLSWVVHGPTGSLAYQACEQGFDVFLGNFRGIYPRKLCSWKDPKTYWDYNLDHFAKYDIQAFIKRIHDIKIEELREEFYKDSQLTQEEIVEEIMSRLSITFVGHSLGGMVLPMYLIHQRMKKEPHYLNHAILLSPAGILKHSPAPVALSFGWFVKHFVSKVTDHIALPSLFVDMMQKLQNDVKSLPAARDLVNYISFNLVGGYATSDSPMWKSAQLMKSFFYFGFSVDLCKHFYLLWKSGQFLAFDYGQKKNLEMYGTSKPFNYLDHYHLIDIPINFFISMNDMLIRADDILEQYHTLRSHHKQLAFVKVFEGFSHIDFNYGSHHSMNQEVLNALNNFVKSSDNVDSSNQDTNDEDQKVYVLSEYEDFMLSMKVKSLM